MCFPLTTESNRKRILPLPAFAKPASVEQVGRNDWFESREPFGGLPRLIAGTVADGNRLTYPTTPAYLFRRFRWHSGADFL
jgi:hypothetical protein